jgi:hypothetical protein
MAPLTQKSPLPARAPEVIRLLKEEYPDARIALVFSNPLECLVATILSAHEQPSAPSSVVDSMPPYGGSFWTKLRHGFGNVVHGIQRAAPWIRKGIAAAERYGPQALALMGAGNIGGPSDAKTIQLHPPRKGRQKRKFYDSSDDDEEQGGCVACPDGLADDAGVGVVSSDSLMKRIRLGSHVS